jgi:UDP-N-acetylmuramate--alanine ligase
MPDDPDRTVDWLAASRRPHLVGVAGAAMRSLAALLLAMGREVSGSDSGAASEIEALRGMGIDARHGHRAEHIDGADLVVASAAVPAENPELISARERGIPVLSHAQALGALMASRDGIGVAGTHGKSTTTALVAHILETAGLHPTLAGGAHALDFDGFARIGNGPHLVAEADEYGRRFLELHPRAAIITGVEPDHLDYYGTFDAVRLAFQQFVAGMAPDGFVITCEDGPHLSRLQLARRRIRYGWAGHADWRLERFRARLGGGATFAVRRPDGERRTFDMLLSGRHHAANAVASLALTRELGVPESAARAALATFQGTRRRFETVAQAGGIWVVDDYAHHPTAVAANISAARDVHSGRIVAIFQPHTIHRTLVLLEELRASFTDADRVILAPIYQPTGRGGDVPTITSEAVVAGMAHPDVVAAPSMDAAFEMARAELRPGTLVLVLGAGDITAVARRLAAAVQQMTAVSESGVPVVAAGHASQSATGAVS